MEDLSVYVRNLQLLHKKKADQFTSVVHGTKNRVEQLKTNRRDHRIDRAFKNRHIPENMSPVPMTPRERALEQAPVQPPVNVKRLEMLAKWKAEKEKKKREAERLKKPVFKVTSVRHEVGLPNLENVNKEIKGKPIVTATKKPTVAPVKERKTTTTTTRATPRAKIVTRSQTLKKKTSLPKTTLEVPSTNVVTPKKNTVTPPLYISPFVTLTRGKNNVRRESQARKQNPNCSPSAGANYFSWLVDQEVERLQKISDTWETYKITNPTLLEEATSMIDVATGQTNLLIAKKIQQFRGLIEESKSTPDRITLQDLHGFWDLLKIQSDNLDSRFANLERLRTNNWEEVLPQRVVVARKPLAVKTTVKIDNHKAAKASSGLKAAILAAKSRQNGEQKVEETKVRTPRKSLVESLTRSRRDSSPGIVMIKVTNAVRDLGTPSKSILRNCASSVSTTKKSQHSRTVGFVDENDGNLANVPRETKSEKKRHTVAMTPTRRSTRLSTKVKLFD